MSGRVSRRESQARTRAALLDAGARVFVERGLSGASVDAIATAAGFTRGAFYSNFSSKEELFTELLHDRIYSYYREMAERRMAGLDDLPTLRETGEELARIQEDPRGRWLLRLILELLAQAGRDEKAQELARTFWSGNRALTAELTKQAYAREGTDPPAGPELLATALIALDIGLSLQRYVDPQAVPLSAWPELYELLFERLGPSPTGDREPARADRPREAPTKTRQAEAQHEST